VKNIVIVFLISLFLSSLALSQPNKEIPKYLLTNPITLMDYGIDSLNRSLNRISQVKGFENIVVSSIFREGKNEFELKVNSLGNAEKTVEDAKFNCKRSINNIRELLGVNPTTGKPYSGHSSNFGAFFESYNVIGEPKDMRLELDKMVSIIGFFSIEETNTFIQCSGYLLSSTVEIREPRNHIKH